MPKSARDTYRSAFNVYSIVEKIGEGGSGTVYEVLDQDSNRYALKSLDPKKTTSQKLKRFQNEIRFCQQTVHKNVIRVLDTGSSVEGKSFYVMERYPCTLQEMIGKLSEQEILPAFAQILDGVEVAHLRTVAQRDLKPQNILCDPAKNLYVMADFGIADFAEEELYTAVETGHNERLANFQYAAPEQRVRGREVGLKADIYALGLMLDQMFTSEIPLGTGFTKVGAVAPQFAYLDDLIELMIRQDPHQRPSIADIKSQLIARQQQFVSLQRIDALSNQVVREDAISDPLVVDPIQPTAFDYDDGYMVVTLSRLPNNLWRQKFGTQSSTQFLGLGPETVTFQGAIARVPTKRSIVAQQKAYFEGWVRNANGLYEEEIKSQRQEEKRRLEAELQQRLARERERHEMLRILNA